MMIVMEVENLANAIKQAKKRKPKLVRRIDDETYAVHCDKGHKHIVYFMFDGERLHATCDCPSRVACYHLVHARDLYEFYITQAAEAEAEMRAQEVESQTPAKEALSRNANMDNSILATAPRGADKCGAIRV